MSEETMPAAEANERNSYELAFHILPTVAEGEVSGVFDSIKALITTHGGELTNEESPERFELAYEVIKHIDTKNRKFSSAYFGWVRFTAEAEAVAPIVEEIDADANLLRHLLLKLSKVEEAEPFRFHEALEDQKVVTIDAEAPKPVVEEAVEKAEKEEASEETTEEEKDKEEETA